jgi:hypothetical protein
MARNNYDEGGSDLAARPETSAKSVVAEAQDNVDALSNVLAAAGPYFSAGASSPSLDLLPGSAMPSGAHVFHYNLANTVLYASFTDLGLVQDDDVDALVVFDRNLNRAFDGSDTILFSLTADSPSLDTIPGASLVGAAADVFIAEPGQPPTLFAAAVSLGLGAATDDLDALEIFPCANPTACARDYGIRRIWGDFDDDGDVDEADQETFENCFSGEGQPAAPGCEPADADGDGDVDCTDWSAFVDAWTGPGTLFAIEQCSAVIPTVSSWGLVIAALATLCAGAIVLVRREPGSVSLDTP